MSETIPKALRENDSFKSDLEAFVQAHREVLEEIANKLGPVRTVISEQEIQELAKKFSLEKDSIDGPARILMYLRARIIDKDISPQEAADEIEEILGSEPLGSANKDKITSLLEYSEEDRSESLAVKAFSLGSTFLAANFRPGYIQVEGDTLVGGFIATVSYMDSEGNIRDFTFGLSPGELDQVERRIQAARDAMRNLRKRTLTHKEP